MRNRTLTAMIAGACIVLTTLQTAPAAELALSFQPHNIVQERTVPAFQAFEFYLLAKFGESQPSLKAFAGSIQLDPAIVFASAEYPESWYNSGIRIEDGEFRFLVQGPACVDTTVDWMVLSRFEAILLELSHGVFIGVGDYEENAGSYPPTWLDCSTGQHVFGILNDAAEQLTVSAENVATSSESWGAVKSLYR